MVINPFDYQKSTNIKEHNQIVDKLNEVIEVVNEGVGIDAYTKAETDALLREKQNNLRAIGIVNISDNNDISADAFSKFETTEMISGVTNTVEGLTRTVESMQSSKQDKLTAGNGIIISNNVISATGSGEVLESGVIEPDSSGTTVITLSQAYDNPIVMISASVTTQPTSLMYFNLPSLLACSQINVYCDPNEYQYIFYAILRRVVP